MNDPENFLKRWSRRKSEAADENTQSKVTGAEHADKSPGEQIDQSLPGPGPTASSAPEFDVSSLPPIESIDAGTDISAFMKPGVPSALRHAALRRMWAADPAIRDFVEANENYWDAAGPGGVPGFGDLDPDLDIKRMVSEVFGEPVSDRAPADSPGGGQRPQQVADSADSHRAQDDATAQSEQFPVTADQNLLHRTDDAAPQKQSSELEPAEKAPRRHGSAMPQ